MGVTLRDDLERLGACPESRKWAARRRSPTKAWRDCPDGSWLAWVLVRTARTDAERREALGVVCAVVREIAPPRDPASERALSLAEAWCRGKRVSRRDLTLAAYGANAAYGAYAAAFASSSAAYAASAAWAAAWAAANAAYGAYAAAFASSSAAYAADAAADAAACGDASAATAGAAAAIRRRLPAPPAWVLSACEVTP